MSEPLRSATKRPISLVDIEDSDTDDATKPIYNPSYSDKNNADADLVIQTNDNVLFRVHSYYLKAHSTYFRSMPEKDGLVAETDADSTVHLNCRSEPFEVLLDSLRGFLPPDQGYGVLRLDQIQQVLDVGARYGFTSLPRIISPIMHIYAIKQPWDVFKFAAKADLPILAAYCLDQLSFEKKFAGKGVMDFDHKLLRGIPPKYTLPLIRNMTIFHGSSQSGWDSDNSMGLYRGATTGTTTGAARWKDIAYISRICESPTKAFRFRNRIERFRPCAKTPIRGPVNAESPS